MSPLASRKGTAVALTGLALLLLFGQMLWGFPLKNSIVDGLARQASEQRAGPWDNQNTSVVAAAMIHVSFTVWFWLWLLTMLFSLVPLAAELVTRQVAKAMVRQQAGRTDSS